MADDRGNPTNAADQGGAPPLGDATSDPGAALRRQAEQEITANDTEIAVEPSPEETRRMLHELRVHQLELEMQNEELRRAHEALERIQERYFELYDLAPVGYVTLSDKGLIHEANLTASTLLGTTRGALVRQPLGRFVLPEHYDAFYCHCRRLFEGHHPPACELQLRRGDDASVWARLESIAAVDPESGAAICRTVISDITPAKETERELRESERRLRRAQAIARIGDWEWQVPSGRVMWSDEVYRLFGLRSSAVAPSYELARSLVHPDDLERWEQTIATWLAPGGPSELEYRVRLADGSIRWVRNEVEVEHDTAGTAVRVSGTVQDITERRRAERTLAQAERRFRETIENVDLIAVGLDTAGRVTFANDHLLRLTGWRRDEVLDRDWFDTFVPAAARAAVRDSFVQTAQEGEFPPHFDNPIVTRAGRERIVHWSNTVLRDRDGGITGTFSLGEDRTDVLAVETALRASEEHYRTLFKTMRQGVFYQTADGTLLDANPAALDMFGLTLDELRGRTPVHPEWDVVREDGTPLAAIEHPSMVALATGREVRDVVTGVLNPRTGSRVWLSVNATPEFHEGASEPFRVAVTLHDLTERKLAESELREQLDELRRWHEITLDREQRVLELKCEVNEVLAMAGQPARYATTAAGTTDPAPAGRPSEPSETTGTTAATVPETE